MNPASIPRTTHDAARDIGRQRTMNDKRKYGFRISSAVAISVLLNGGVYAQNSKEWSQCIGREGPNADVVIEGCTAIIQEARETPAKLSTAFNNRGVAYRLK